MGLLFNRNGKECNHEGKEVAGGQSLPLESTIAYERGQGVRPATGGNKYPEMEGSYETGMDEQAKQAAMSKLGESVTTLARDNDRSSDYCETLKYQHIDHVRRMQNLEYTRNLEDLKFARDSHANTQLNNIRAGEHHGHGYDRLVNLEPAEGKAISTMLDGDIIKAIQVAVVESTQIALAQLAKQK